MIRLFEPIDGEMRLIEANAKFNYTTNKTPELETKSILAHTENAEQLTRILKERIKLLMDTTSQRFEL